MDEHATLSAPATVDLQKVFGKAGFTITEATEMTVTANQPRANFTPYVWPTEDVTNGRMYKSDNPSDVRIPFNPADMVATIRPMEVKTFLVQFGKTKANTGTAQA